MLRRKLAGEKNSEYIKTFLEQGETYSQVGFKELYERAWWWNWMTDNPNQMPSMSQTPGTPITDISGYFNY